MKLGNGLAGAFVFLGLAGELPALWYYEVAEWSKASDSKSFNRKLFVGSNPTLSVNLSFLEVIKINNRAFICPLRA